MTRKWLNPIPPALEGWQGINLEIADLTYSLRIQKVEFYKIWEKWI